MGRDWGQRWRSVRQVDRQVMTAGIMKEYTARRGERLDTPTAHTHRHPDKKGQVSIQRDRQSDKQTDRQTDRQILKNIEQTPVQ